MAAGAGDGVDIVPTDGQRVSTRRDGAAQQLQGVSGSAIDRHVVGHIDGARGFVDDQVGEDVAPSFGDGLVARAVERDRTAVGIEGARVDPVAAERDVAADAG